MLIKTRGIVFRFTRYGDSSIIVSVFTEHAGLQSYIIKGIRKSKHGTGIALYQPLTILDMVVYERDGASVNHVREAKCRHIYRHIPGNMIRETIAFFINELMTRSIREQSHPEELYEYLEHSLLQLDGEAEPPNDFHLHFMSGLSCHLGFGARQTAEIAGGRVLPDELQAGLQHILDGNRSNLSREYRREILALLADFYRDHIENFGQLKSVEVLQEILSNSEQ
ncbi:MAG: DNA repair protein RecO [Cyclobacteriaceae bacterium]